MAIRDPRELEVNDSLDTLMPRAPKHCSHHDCWNQALPGQRNCMDHGNSRWPTGDPFRYMRMDTPQIMAAYGRIVVGDCKIGYVGICTGEAEELDHIVPYFEGGDDEDENLQGACAACHAAKSSDEGHRAQGHNPRVRQRISDVQPQ